MVPSSSIAVTADSEHLACGGFSLGEPILFGNFDFITDYFGVLSLSQMGGNDGFIFVGSTHCGASTPQRVLVEDSTEEFLTRASGEGSISHSSPRQHSTGALFSNTTTATWKENVPTMTRFSLQMVVPQPETNHPTKRQRAHHDGQLTPARAQHPTTEPGSASR
jgi:hypothetical protein